MRSLKSLLGSSLMQEQTEIGNQRISFEDIIALFLSELATRARRQLGVEPARVVIGRPVHFVDDDPERDRQAEATLRRAARSAGLGEVGFQYEPIAAAFDYERRVSARIAGADRRHRRRHLRLHGGAPRAPNAWRRADRSSDVLATTGVHIGGTDFDQRLSLECVMPHLGFRHIGPQGREVPSRTLLRPVVLAPDQLALRAQGHPRRPRNCASTTSIRGCTTGSCACWRTGTGTASPARWKQAKIRTSMHERRCGASTCPSPRPDLSAALTAGGHGADTWRRCSTAWWPARANACSAPARRSDELDADLSDRRVIGAAPVPERAATRVSRARSSSKATCSAAWRPGWPTRRGAQAGTGMKYLAAYPAALRAQVEQLMAQGGSATGC